MNNDLHALFTVIAERVIPGGCDDCDAEQTIKPDPDVPGAWRCVVAHDDGCPTYARMETGETP